jgi:hypothetical protein
MQRSALNKVNAAKPQFEPTAQAMAQASLIVDQQ